MFNFSSFLAGVLLFALFQTISSLPVGYDETNLDKRQFQFLLRLLPKIIGSSARTGAAQAGTRASAQVVDQAASQAAAQAAKQAAAQAAKQEAAQAAEKAAADSAAKSVQSVKLPPLNAELGKPNINLPIKQAPPINKALLSAPAPIPAPAPNLASAPDTGTLKSVGNSVPEPNAIKDTLTHVLPPVNRQDKIKSNVALGVGTLGVSLGLPAAFSAIGGNASGSTPNPNTDPNATSGSNQNQSPTSVTDQNLAPNSGSAPNADPNGTSGTGLDQTQVLTNGANQNQQPVSGNIGQFVTDQQSSGAPTSRFVSSQVG